MLADKHLGFSCELFPYVLEMKRLPTEKCVMKIKKK